MKLRTARRAAGGVLFSALALLAACGDQQPTAPAVTPPPATGDLAARVAAMGFRADMIVDRGDHFVVEGDIVIRKNDLMRPSLDRVGAPGGPLHQWHTTNLVSQSTMARGIRVNLSGISGNSAWTTAVREAIQQWNWTWGTKIYLSEASPADITFSFGSLGAGTVALASFPSGGLPGSTVTIGSAYASSYSASQKRWVMVHEIGHTLGYRHTNWDALNEEYHPDHNIYGAVHISGTPTGNDASSVFRGGLSSVPSWNGFSTNDATGNRYLFPAPAPTLTSDALDGAYHVALQWTAVPDASYYRITRLERVEEFVYDPTFPGSGYYTWQTYHYPDGTTTGTSYTTTGTHDPAYCSPSYNNDYEVTPVYPSGRAGSSTYTQTYC
jgi:Dual-action HEIGH metallo-peptidase